MSSNTKVRAPREAPVESLAFVGKSWFKRGVRYWVLRSLATLFGLLMTCMICAMATGVTIGIINAGASPWIIVPIVVAVSALSSVQTARSIVRKQREQEVAAGYKSEPGPARKSAGRERSRRLGAGAGALGAGLSALGSLGAFVVALCLPIAVGVFPVYLWYWLKPFVPGELRARRELARWLTVHRRQDEIPANWRTS